MMAATRLYFFGQPHFERDGRSVDLVAAKAVGLLAYLATTHTPQPRERLMDLLWPDSLPEAARKNLRNALWAIGKVLGDGTVTAGDDRLALGEDVWVDLRQFESMLASGSRATSALDRSAISDLQAAIDLYAGPLLDGFTLTDAPDFELWLTTERERLAQAHLRVLATLLEAHRAQQEWQQVIAIARRALAQDDLQEPMHRALMEAHARLGERPEALRQYDTLRATLQRELGVEPLPETEAVRRDIVEGRIRQDGEMGGRGEWANGGVGDYPRASLSPCPPLSLSSPRRPVPPSPCPPV